MECDNCQVFLNELKKKKDEFDKLNNTSPTMRVEHKTSQCSIEFGPAKKRFKIYFDNADDLLKKLEELDNTLQSEIANKILEVDVK